MRNLLEQRVKEFNIPKWPGECTFGRVMIFRIPDKASARDTFVPGGAIVKPETVKSNEEFRSPRGVVVSAGLQAMDILRGNGIGLGHIVWISSYTPWRFEVDRNSDGESIEFMFMQAGDITLSEDLVKMFKEGKARIERKDGRHTLVIDDEYLPRFDPFEHPDAM